MHKSKRVKPSEGTTDLDMTALIDVVFLLIIFFMLACRLKDTLTNAKVNLPMSPMAVKDEKVIPDLFVLNIESDTQKNNAPAVVKFKGEELYVGPIYIKQGTQRLDQSKYTNKELQYHLFQYTNGLRDAYGKDYSKNQDEAIVEHGVVKLRIDQHTEFQHIKQVQDLLNMFGIKNIAYGANLKM